METACLFKKWPQGTDQAPPISHSVPFSFLLSSVHIVTYFRTVLIIFGIRHRRLPDEYIQSRRDQGAIP